MKKYNYTIESGLTRIKSKTKKYISGAISSFAIAGAVAVPVLAAQPANPGCFGTDRAAYIKNVAQAEGTAPGASEVGVILSGRASDNGQINRAYVCQP